MLSALLLASLPLLSASLHAQTPLRVATYNVLDFGQSTSGDSVKVGALRRVLAVLDPDLFAVQEIRSLRALEGFRDSVVFAINPNLVPAPFLPDTSPNRPDNALFYDSTLFVLLRSDTLESGGRVTPRYLVRERGSGDTIEVLVAHLQPAGDRAARAVAARHIRDYLRTIPETHHAILAGDLNLYTSSEEAYIALLDSAEPRGRLLDPLDMPGDWDGEEAFAEIHTHATRSDAGRMNSRFDFILISPSLLPLYVPNSYRAFGNDGKHFDDSLNRPPYAPGITPEIAQALHDASDHLPVVMEIAFGAMTEVRRLNPRTARLYSGRDGVVAEWDGGERYGLEATLHLYSLDGARVGSPSHAIRRDGSRFLFPLEGQAANGVYVVRIESNGITVAAGRLDLLR